MSAPLVLVVDDDPDILEAVSDILEGEGYRVARARHGVEALDRVEAERPDLVLLDLVMPVMDGAGFVRALRERGDDIPTVVISAEGGAGRARAVGVQGFLAKPFDIDALLSRVAALAGSPGEGGSGRRA
jgi:CheY-like chemotaxis protein